MGNKIYTYTILIVGILMIFVAAGIIESGDFIGVTISKPSDLFDLNNWNFFKILTENLVALGFGGGAILIGYFAKASALETATAVMGTTVIIKFIEGLIMIFRQLNSTGMEWISWLALLIFAPLVIGYIIATWEWVGGRD